MKLERKFFEALARKGATQRMAELKDEITALEKLIHDGIERREMAQERGTVARRPRKPTKRRVSAKQRRETSKRMKAYWAARRKE
jgi:hypothetical protein